MTSQKHTAQKPSLPPGLLDQPSVIVWPDADEWRWRCEKCGERSKATFTSEFDAALAAGRHVRDRHAAPVDLSPGWTKRVRRTLYSDEQARPETHPDPPSMTEP